MQDTNLARTTRRHSSAVSSLADTIARIETEAPRREVAEAVRRGYFRPLEEEALITWFSRLLTVRDALWEVMAEGAEHLGGLNSDRLSERFESPAERRLFLVSYIAACLIVRLDRLLVEDLATHSTAQRKLNEGSRERRIPRKQYTAIFESLSQPRNALLMRSAMMVTDRQREWLEGLADDPELGALARRLAWFEEPLDPSKTRYLNLLLDFTEHAVRRWAASTTQKASLSVLESSGRMVAELRDHWGKKRVTAAVRDRLRSLLQPGDVMVTRHDVAMSNLFLPGYWPHVALYVGDHEQRDQLGVCVPEDIGRHWRANCSVLEALKDGVHFRPLEETLEVDAVAVLRPALDRHQIARAIERVAPHRGKLYNFDFDFFRSDRLVCTEVVYRAFDGPMTIPLHDRAGRPTLSAEDLLDLALDDDLFEVIAVYGATGCEASLLEGRPAYDTLAGTYRP